MFFLKRPRNPLVIEGEILYSNARAAASIVVTVNWNAGSSACSSAR
jgi:hypothetical protein